MRILMASDFFVDFELVEVSSVGVAEEYIRSAMGGTFPQGIEVLGSSDSMLTDDAMEMCDKILYVSDYESED